MKLISNKKKAEFYDWRWAEPLELPKLIVPFKKKNFTKKF